MAERIRDINPEIELTVLPEFIEGERTREIAQNGHFDYAVDCIDTLSAKVNFIKLKMLSGWHFADWQFVFGAVFQFSNCQIFKFSN
jgi:tRNA A37 threonylcarbamoyladenosine dehydratase